MWCTLPVQNHVSQHTEKDKEGEDKTMLDIFHSTVPVPMRVLGRKYEADNELQLWYFMERKVPAGFF